MLHPIPIRRYLTVMHAKGFDSRSVLSGTNISSHRLDDPDYLIELRQYQHLIENMLRLAGDNGLGLDVGLARDVTDYGAMGYAALSCGSVRQAFEEVWARYGDSLGMMANVAVPTKRGRMVSVYISNMGTTEPTQRFLVEEALMLVFKLGGEMLGGAEPAFERLQFRYPAPGYRARYESMFLCPIEFGAEYTRAIVSREWLERPLVTRDGALRQLLQRYLRDRQREVETGLAASERLLRLFAQYGGWVPSLDDAARALGFSSRTLRRRLREEGKSYRKLVEKHRIELALEILQTGPAYAKQVAQRVGFSDVTAFHRAFKRWTGKSLSEYRTSWRHS